MMMMMTRDQGLTRRWWSMQEEGTPEEDEPVPQTKGKTKKAKGKTAHPSFMFTGPASGGAKSISARPTRAEKTLT